MTATLGPPAAQAAPPTRPALRPLLAQHRVFLVALAAGTAVRVLVHVSFWPAFVFSDGPTYLDFLDRLEPHPDRPVGYGVLVLLPLSWLSDGVWLVAVAQHLLGLLTAVLLYALLQRHRVGVPAATAACLPVLLDTMQLVLEHAVLSDVLFCFLVVLAMLLLGWHPRPTGWLALAAGAVLGLAVTVRLVGEALPLLAAAYCLLVGVGVRRRLLTAAVVVVGTVLPVGAYMAWYDQERGTLAVAEFTADSLYARTTTFVECGRLPVPAYQRVLCPAEPRGQREDPTEYLFHDRRTLPRLDPPAGTTRDEALRDFAGAAIRAQPIDYAATVLRDFALNFDIWRGDRFEFDTSYKWRFESYLLKEPTPWTRPAYAEHGGEQLTDRPPLSYLLALYGWTVYLPGPLLLGCWLLGWVGGLARGRGRGRWEPSAALCLLLVTSATVLLLVPATVGQFVWRYQLPALTLLPAAAALAITRLGLVRRLRGRAAADT